MPEPLISCHPALVAGSGQTTEADPAIRRGDNAELKTRLRELALAHGFDTVGFAAPNIGTDAQTHLREFLDRHYHGDMGWMLEKADRRAHPKHIWPDVQSIIVVGQNYSPPFDPMARLEQKEAGVISAYALNKDYHDVMKKKLRTLAQAVTKEFGGEKKLFVDTAPVMEKPLAAATRIGWQGKHTCVVSRQHGGWLFLGELFTTLDISPDEPEANHCGSCTRCLDICPTRAFDEAGKLDARKCISYLTIEHKGHIGEEFRPAMGNRIYGCDDCLAVCPWNKFAEAAHESAFHPRADLIAPLLADLAQLDDAGFRARFSGSPVKRIGRDRFVRNVLIAIGNSANNELLAVVRPLLSDPSALVRAMAVWSLRRLAHPQEFATLREQHLLTEGDTVVRQEWLPS